ncbi:mercuric transporter [Staphylococcus aureus]|uniref:Mercuric transporter n=1 Tax=Staphylococcus aureus TaxID=1280 RepID=A0A380EA20_STAAU|nr:mercuric transporter [Staphylococcus aureus]
MYLNQRIKFFLERVVRMMDENRSKGNRWGVWAFFGILLVPLLVPLLCCAGPILLVALGSTGIGALFAGATGNWWLTGIFAALAIVMIALILSKLLKNKYNSPEGNGKNKK